MTEGRELPRLPLPVPQHMAHPERGLIDVFPDGTRIAGRINHQSEDGATHDNPRLVAAGT
eukprot:COSAG06_NODE_5840_length_3249_cov_8.054921_2_plen_60_part_00